MTLPVIIETSSKSRTLLAMIMELARVQLGVGRAQVCNIGSSNVAIISLRAILLNIKN